MQHPLLSRRAALWGATWLPVAALLTALVAAESDILHAAALVLPLVLLFAFVGAAAFYPCRVHPLEETGLGRLAVVHGSATAIATLGWIGLGSLWAAALSQLARFGNARELFARQLPLFAASGVLLYLLATAGHYLFLALERSHEARRRALEAEIAAREAQLAALKTQIDPHFLFNCLHSVSSLCGSDPARARQMTERLATFFRSTLKLSAEERVPLARELALAAGYLEIESVRFGDRLEWRQQVGDGCSEALVPALLLQPLLENALKHGIAHRLEGGCVELTARRRDGILEVAIENPCDDDRPRGRGAGVGLTNIRRRLATLFGNAASLDAQEQGGRFRVVLTLPWEDAADDHG